MMLRRESRLLWIMKPLSVLALLFSVFLMVWLKSSVVSLEYSISSLEKKKTELMRERKLFAAERANLLSVERFQNVAANGFEFPDRVKVVYVKSLKTTDTYTASLHADKR